jgi:hypothetical protein
LKLIYIMRNTFYSPCRIILNFHSTLYDMYISYSVLIWQINRMRGVDLSFDKNGSGSLIHDSLQKLQIASCPLCHCLQWGPSAARF